ncbi:hypothetical protein GCM10009657_17150 [Oryzihumus leptocrescens]
MKAPVASGLSSSVERRPRHVPRTGLIALVILALAMGWLGWRKAYGEWVPSGDPPRLFACGRTYQAGSLVAVKPGEATHVIGHYPPLLGRDLWSREPLPSAPCPTGLFLQTSGGYRGYGLSGGP